MKPDPNVSGIPYNFDTLPIWLFPSLWDETKKVGLRGLWFVILYTLSTLIVGALVFFPLAIIFSKPIISMAWSWILICSPSGFILGLSAWWDFTRKRKVLQVNEVKALRIESKDELITTRFKNSLLWRWLWLIFCVFLAFVFIMSIA